MTPFMTRVAEAVDGEADVERPHLRPSVAKSVPVGADEQMVLRALAEQLVSEANAVLYDNPQHIELTDRLIDGQIGFTMSFGARTAVVRTAFDHHAAVGELEGFGGRNGDHLELAGLDQLENLILLLLCGDHPA
jgi:hypothetical protein